MRNGLLVMSLSGSLTFGLYLGLRHMLRKYAHPVWRYRLLKVTLAFYLLPIPLFWNKCREFLRNHGLWSGTSLSIKRSALYRDYVVWDGEHFVVSNYMAVVWSISACAVLVALFLLSWFLYRYHKTKKRCFQNGKPCSEIQSEAPVWVSEQVDTPFVIGVRKPTVILPADLSEHMDAQMMSLCMQHELTHIRQHDLFYRFLALTVICLHWWNPLCYWLKREITIVSEICCDAEVLRGAASRHVKSYFAALIVQAQDKTVSSQVSFPDKLLVQLSGGGNQEIRRRLQEIEVMKNPKKRVLGVLSGLLVVAAGTMSVMAYEPPSLYDVSRSEDTAIEQFQAEQTFYPEYEYGYEYGKLFPTIPFDCFFTDEEGNVSALLPEEQSQPICEHNFQSGTMTRHTKTAEGDCIIQVYHAERCTKCGIVIQYDGFFKQTSKPCFH